MVKIRLTRVGAKKRPFYRIVAIDERRPRDGRPLAYLGTFDPCTKPERVRLEKERIEAWEAKRYHQPSDELTPDWNFDGMIDDARLGFEAAWGIAQADAMPRWNAGDEFEAARKTALAAAAKVQ